MSRRTQRHRHTALPFPHRPDGLSFDLNSYSIGGRKPKDLELKAGQREIDISPGADRDTTDTIPEDWEFITFYGELEVLDSVVEDVFPSEEREAPPGNLHIAVHCHETISRTRIDIESAPIAEDRYDVSIRLDWNDFRGRVRLEPFLVRSEPGKSDSEYATSPHAKLAGGNAYEIVVDRYGEDEPPSIDGEEESFSQADHLPDSDRLYYLDFRDEARPKLWINADYPRVTDVLGASGSVGAEPRMRDVILDQITYAVWNQLLVRTATAIDRDGSVEYDWQENVLQAFGRQLYGIDNLEEATLRLREDIRDAENIPSLMERIDGELQEFVEPREQYLNLMEEGLQL